MAVMLSKTRMVPAPSEPALVAAARAGDDRAFEQLYFRYRDRILGFIRSRVHDHGRAEDITQEVFISALRRLRANDQEIAFKPWIYEIAKNACIDEFRRGTRAREVSTEFESDVVIESPTTLSVVPGPVAAVESKMTMDDLRGAFGGLSENHHQMLVMREFEGMSYDEIGDRMEMTRQMVESGLFRARRKLTEEYEELASGRRCQQIQVAISEGAMVSARSLGIKDRRRFARHLSHCQVCRHEALQAGVDEALVKPRSIAAKIAALLPFPLLRWPWRGSTGRGARFASRTGTHHLVSGSLKNAAAMAEPAAGSAVSLSPAAVAAAALAIAGLGGGLIHAATDGGHPTRSVTAVPVAALTSASQDGSDQAASRAAGRSSAAATTQRSAAAFEHARAVMTFTSSSSSVAGRPIGKHQQGSSHGGAGAPGAATAAGRSSSPKPASGAPAGGTHHSILNDLPSGGPVNVGSLGSAVTSTAQHVVATTKHLVATAGNEVSSVGNAVAGPPVKTIQSLIGSVTKAASGTAASSGSPASSPSASSTSSTPSVTSVTQPLKQAVDQVAQGLLPK
jgi:RNA polymerase sigma factor (sigma-70 family)